jgi:hypothetical protein
LSKARGFPAILKSGIWHTTSERRFNAILEAGQILPNPASVPEAERWYSKGGAKTWPYVRHIDGVSLFEFAEFDEDRYWESYPLSTWREFVPYRKQWGRSVWIEINRESLGSNYLGPVALLQRWKDEKAHTHTLMPMIEAASLVPIPRACSNEYWWRVQVIPG